MSFKKIITPILVAATLFVTAISVSAATSETTYSIQDATNIQKYIVGRITLDEEKQQEYDFNCDGRITILDATYLQKLLVNIHKEDTTASSSTVQPTTEQFTTEVVTIEPTTEHFTTEAVTTEPTTIVYPSTLSLNKAELALGVGEKYTLIMETDVADYPFTFTTTNQDVATVDNNGTIEAINCGTAEIFCTTENGLSANCTVTVGNMAQSITLNQTDFKLGVGETFCLNSSIPDGTTAYFRWYTSSNTDVASVEMDGGLVTAKAVGTTTISCTLYNGVTATCTLTVREAPTSATLTVSSKELKVGEDFIIAEYTNSGSYSYSFTWSSSNTEVATITKTTTNKAKISPKMQGTTTITFKTYNGKTATCKITVKGSNVKCLDVSYAQGNIDFDKVKADGYDYVIIRAGYGKEKYQKDEYFEQNYKNAKAAGLKVGAYWYAYATSEFEALEEAETCLYCIEGKTFDMPIYYDIEEQSQAYLSRQTLTKVIDTFCTEIEKNDYRAGIYSSNGMYWNTDKEYLKSKYSIWLAQIDGNFSNITDDVHQYTWTQRVNGIYTNVDCNYIYNLNIVQ